MLSSETPHLSVLDPTPASGVRAQRPSGGGDTTSNVIGHLRRARAGLESYAVAFPALRPAIRALARLEDRLVRPLRIAIIGEFNSGKSSLANLLVGIDSLPTAIVSNTRIPTLLYFAEAAEIFSRAADGARMAVDAGNTARANEAIRLEVGLPAPRLRTLQVIDLPGLSDPDLDESAADLTPHGVDAVVWCTVATQAWKETERRAWSDLSPRLRNRGLLVVTHRDLLASAADEAKLLSRLRGAARGSFRDIVMLSTVAGAEPALIALPPDEGDASRQSESFAVLLRAIDDLVGSVRQQRSQRAVDVVNRIAAHALARIVSNEA